MALSQKAVNVFTVIGVLATIASVGVAVYYGQKQLRSPGVVVEGVDELIQSEQQQTAVSLEIRDAIVPVDEIAALANRGYSIDGVSFFKALKAGDKASLRMFCSADVAPIDVQMVNFRGMPLTEDITRMLKDCSFIALGKMCTLPVSDTGSWGGRPGFNYDEEMTVTLCGRAAYRDAYARWGSAAAAYDLKIAEACRKKVKEFADRHAKWGGHSPTTSTEQIRLRSSEFGRDCARLGIEI